MPRTKPVQAAPTNTHDAAIDVLREHSLTTLVQRELERQIIAGELEAGAKLNEAEIAAELRVSRGPVREAFRALDQSGLVRTEKNRGVFFSVRTRPDWSSARNTSRTDRVKREVRRRSRPH